MCYKLLRIISCTNSHLYLKYIYTQDGKKQILCIINEDLVIHINKRHLITEDKVCSYIIYEECKQTDKR